LKRKSRWFSLAFALTLVLSLLITPGSIDAKPVSEADRAKSLQGQPQMYFIPTSNPKEADHVMQQLKDGKSPEALNLIPANKHHPRKQTLKQMETEASKNPQTYPVKINPVTKADDGDSWTPPPFHYDDIQFDECVENDNVSKGWIKNHYSYCWSNYVVYSDPAGCGPSWFPFGCDWVSFRLTVIGNSYNGTRAVSYNYKIDDIDMDLDSSGWIGSKVSVSTKCDGISETRDCIGDDSPDTRTLAQWQADGEGSTYFDSDPPPITAGNKDQVSFMDLWPRVTVDPPGSKYPPITSDGSKEKVRTDSADYLFVFKPFFYPKEGAIFANAQPVFYYDMNNPYFSIMKEAFQHHKDALTAPGSLIPGIKGRPPLTRLYPNYDPAQKRANDNAKDRACRELRNTLPYDPSERGYECDEFPFATTYEGAGAGDGRFSVRYIPRAANNTHGRWLGAWYAYDRILHKDQFYIDFKE
jgi:hypothetical protein